jgi:peroxiredoxin
VTLKDLNPQSATYNSNITIPDDFADKIELIYFGSASCGYCVTQAGQIKTVLDELKLEGISDAVEIVINNKGLDAYAYKFGSGTDGPVLQDTTEIDAWKILSASSNNLFMVDKQGYIVFLHTSVSFPADNEKIKDEVKSLK